MGSLVVFVEVGEKTFFGKPDIARGVAYRVGKGRKVEEVGEGQDAGFQEEVVSSSSGGRNKEHAKRGCFGVFDGEAVSAGKGGGDVNAKGSPLVVGKVREKFLGDFFDVFG